MNEEEKEAIKVLKNEIEQVKHIDNYEMGYTYIRIKHIEIFLNLIDKQQADYQVLEDDLKDHRIAYIDTPEFEEHYISKDKIRDKIKELENHCFIDDEEDYAIQVLKELLEEE